MGDGTAAALASAKLAKAYQNIALGLHSLTDADGNPFNPKMASVISAIHDPSKTKQDVQHLLNNIQNDADIEVSAREGTPDGKTSATEHKSSFVADI